MNLMDCCGCGRSSCGGVEYQHARPSTRSNTLRIHRECINYVTQRRQRLINIICLHRNTIKTCHSIRYCKSARTSLSLSPSLWACFCFSLPAKSTRLKRDERDRTKPPTLNRLRRSFPIRPWSPVSGNLEFALDAERRGVTQPDSSLVSVFRIEGQFSSSSSS